MALSKHVCRIQMLKIMLIVQDRGCLVLRETHLENSQNPMVLSQWWTAKESHTLDPGLFEYLWKNGPPRCIEHHSFPAHETWNNSCEIATFFALTFRALGKDPHPLDLVRHHHSEFGWQRFSAIAGLKSHTTEVKPFCWGPSAPKFHPNQAVNLGHLTLHAHFCCWFFGKTSNNCCITSIPAMFPSLRKRSWPPRRGRGTRTLRCFGALRIMARLARWLQDKFQSDGLTMWFWGYIRWCFPQFYITISVWEPKKRN